jgi:uncharacterized damage-inducible protein DinB
MPDGTLTEETSALLRALHNQRSHILGALDDLPDEDLRRAVLPTGWTCAGLVQHLTFDVEHFWFHQVVAGHGATEGQPAEAGENAWVAGRDVPVRAVLHRYRQAAERADEVIANTPMDAAPAWWPEELFGGWRLDTVRQIVLHVITETACHAGHLDAARELIDGHTWLTMT